MSIALEAATAALILARASSDARSALPDAPTVAVPPPSISLTRVRLALTLARERIRRTARPSLPGPVSAQG